MHNFKWSVRCNRYSSEYSSVNSECGACEFYPLVSPSVFVFVRFIFRFCVNSRCKYKSLALQQSTTNYVLYVWLRVIHNPSKLISNIRFYRQPLWLYRINRKLSFVVINQFCRALTRYNWQSSFIGRIKFFNSFLQNFLVVFRYSFFYWIFIAYFSKSYYNKR